MDDSSGIDDPEDALRKVSQGFARGTPQILQSPLRECASSAAVGSESGQRGHRSEDSNAVDMTNLCAHCGADMGDCHFRRIYCSAKCKDDDRNELERQARRETLAKRPCLTCGVPVGNTRHRMSAKYCSADCVPRLYREARTCPTCAKVFRIKRRTQTYCCTACGVNTKREDNPRACEVCGMDMPAPLPEQNTVLSDVTLPHTGGANVNAGQITRASDLYKQIEAGRTGPKTELNTGGDTQLSRTEVAPIWPPEARVKFSKE